jgi:HD-like signal output (HDOD) protein
MTVMRNLPPLPEVVHQLLNVMRNEKASANDVAKVLSSDQTLAGKVLKLVNSSFYGVSQEVTTISRAVVILGFSGVRNLALSLGSVEALLRMNEGPQATEFWAHAMANAAAAQSLASYIKTQSDPEEAFLAGLMHDIGAYVLATAVPDVYQEICAAKEGSRLDREREATGFTHTQVGQAILQFWELPQAFCDAARNHHDSEICAGNEQPLTTLVALADVLACVHGGSFEEPATETSLSRLMNRAGLSINEVRQGLRDMEKKIFDMETFMKIAGPGETGARKVAPAQGMTSVVVTTDGQRRDWVTCLLEHFGNTIFPMDTYFQGQAGSDEVDVVLVDPQCMTHQKFEELLTFLGGRQARVVLLIEEDGVTPQGGQDFPALPFVFSRSQFKRILATQPV